jgi:hypothetical protein
MAGSVSEPLPGRSPIPHDLSALHGPAADSEMAPQAIGIA